MALPIPLVEWEEKLESAACLHQVLAWLVAELANNALEDDTCHVVIALSEDKQATLEQKVEKILLLELRQRFFLNKQQGDENLAHYATAIQNLWSRLEKRDAHGCLRHH